MTLSKESGRDVVNRLIGYCNQNPHTAQALFDSLIAHGSSSVKVEGEEYYLSEEERGEFVERYSSEVGPTLWESKRRKL